ncbi:MAG: sugar phosphate nucleotidyltransferase, partial [Phycisphaerae bacterium]
PDLPPENVVLEPLRRDTGPAIVLAALVVAKRWPEAVMIVFPSDHFIGDEEAFGETLAATAERAREGGLGTIGIVPASAATRFGYLDLGQAPEPLVPQPVEAFVEKPDRARAERYLATGRYLWNSGIFAWKARTLLEAARRHLPETCAALSEVAEHVGQPSFDRRAKEAFEQVRAESIDYGIMEKASDVWCVPATFEWDDIGGWLAAERLLPADANGNRIRGRVFIDTVTGCVVIGKPTHPVAVTGLTDCIVVHGDAGTLVCHKSATDRIKPLVERILRGDDP